ncbi:putative porin [Algivirga pacifica]|uniref:Porin n=1 Tax=Algivirga pacifica TaxID=1162670 RepID=A0ABP9DJ43_9BACT
MRYAFILLLFFLPLLNTYAQELNRREPVRYEKGFTVPELKDLMEFQVSEGDTVYIRFKGDFRIRYDDITAVQSRGRLRYRARFGFFVDLPSNFKVGMKLISSDAQGTSGGDPISGNTSFENNGTKKFVFFDWAYASWETNIGERIKTNISFGKFSNPFQYSDVVFDNDYTPEGITNNWIVNFREGSNFIVHAAYFQIDENSNTHRDPFMGGVQAGIDFSRPSKYHFFGGVGYMQVVHAQELTNDAVPNKNVGNTRTEDGVLVHSFRNLMFQIEATKYLGAWRKFSDFPVEVGGELLLNTAIENNNLGWSGFVTLGKADKKGRWEIVYRYKYLERDSWYEEFVDSDYGAEYEEALIGSGQGSGYRPGTNMKGSRISTRYSITNNINMGLIVYFGRLILPQGERDTMVRRWQYNIEFKF